MLQTSSEPLFCHLSSQEEPATAPLSSSSFCSKQTENILDQGFLLGPSDSGVIPNMAAPFPVSFTFKSK